MSQETMGEVLTLIQDTINVALPEGAGPDTELGPDGLGIESLAMIELIIGLERRYQVKLPDAEFEDNAVGTVGELVAVVEKYRDAAGSEARRA
jgi:acyl carrier protein